MHTANQRDSEQSGKITVNSLKITPKICTRENYYNDEVHMAYGNNGRLECWEYMRCSRKSCCAHAENADKFHFFKERTLCGDRFDETFIEWVTGVFSISTRKLNKTVLQPVLMLLGR